MVNRNIKKIIMLFCLPVIVSCGDLNKKEEHKNKKILVICPYPEGVAAGQRLKYEQYFDSWTKDGYEITISSFFSKNSLFSPDPHSIKWRPEETLLLCCGDQGQA